jgi:hypothetical protein
MTPLCQFPNKWSISPVNITKAMSISNGGYLYSPNIVIADSLRKENNSGITIYKSHIITLWTITYLKVYIYLPKPQKSWIQCNHNLIQHGSSDKEVNFIHICSLQIAKMDMCLINTNPAHKAIPPVHLVPKPHKLQHAIKKEREEQ